MYGVGYRPQYFRITAQTKRGGKKQKNQVTSTSLISTSISLSDDEPSSSEDDELDELSSSCSSPSSFSSISSAIAAVPLSDTSSLDAAADGATLFLVSLSSSPAVVAAVAAAAPKSVAVSFVDLRFGFVVVFVAAAAAAATGCSELVSAVFFARVLSLATDSAAVASAELTVFSPIVSVVTPVFLVFY